MNELMRRKQESLKKRFLELFFGPEEPEDPNPEAEPIILPDDEFDD